MESPATAFERTVKVTATQPHGTQKRDFYVQLDGLRALAVLGVMASHWVFVGAIQKLGLGFVGVNLFFVLSGFLITEILLRDIHHKIGAKRIVRNFYIKRSLRIFPIYYLVILVTYVFNFEVSRGLLPYSLTYTLNFYNCITGDFGGNFTHLWSLCIEEQFYLLWPFLLLLVKPKHHLRLIISLVLFAISFRLFFWITDVPHAYMYNYRMMPSALDALGLGALLAYLKLKKAALLAKVIRLWFIPALALLFYLFLSFLPIFQAAFFQDVLSRFLISIFSFFLIGKAIDGIGNFFGRFLEMRWIRFLGKISYGLYLYHLIVTGFFVLTINEFVAAYLLPYLPQTFQFNTYLLTAPLLFLATFLVATVSYYAIEMPFLKLKKKFP